MLLPNPYPTRGSRSRSNSAKHTRNSNILANASSMRKLSHENRENQSFSNSRRNSNMSEEFREYCKNIQGEDLAHRVENISQEYEQRVLRDFKKIGENIPEIKNKVVLINNSGGNQLTSATFRSAQPEFGLRHNNMQNSADVYIQRKNEEEKNFKNHFNGVEIGSIAAKDWQSNETVDQLMREFIADRGRKGTSSLSSEQKPDEANAEKLITYDNLLGPDSARSLTGFYFS